MTDITPLIPKGKKILESYGNGGFRVSGERLEGNIIILPDSVHNYNSGTLEGSTLSDISPILANADSITLVLAGGGKTTGFFPAETERALRQKNITVEYMDTGAACRTYNVLLSEERKVAVVLIAV